MIRMLLIALGLTGCAGSFSIPPLQPREPVVPAGDTITIAPNGTETIEPARALPQCAMRARFAGTVTVPCDLATMVRP
jgi:hypothetical protein